MKKIFILLLLVIFNTEIVYAQDYDNYYSNTLSTNTYNSPYSIVHKTGNKEIKIEKSCTNTKCIITINMKWFNMPKIRSYDVLGARFEGTTLLNEPTTTLFLDGVKKNITMYTVKKSNGFGVSFKLPTGGSSLNITQMFEVSIGGTVYASYQHANKTSTLDKSKDYSISKNGYGGVFLFSTLSSSYYDGMDGVYI